MDPHAQKRLDWKNVIVSLVCLLGTAASAYFLYQDFNAKGRAGLGAPMAKLERREAKVRRKPGSSYIWSVAELDEQLYKKDSVQTGAGSAATIKLNDGSSLELGENSLVVIDDMQNLAFNTMRGSLIIRRSNGSDARVTIGKDGKAKVEELPLRLIKPEPQANLYAPGSDAKSVKFSWEPRSTSGAGGQTAADETYTLQISPDRSFNSLRTISMPIESPAAREAESKLTPGRYFWRMLSKSGAVTEARQFKVASAQPLRPVWPSAAQRILSWGDDSAVQFKWVSGQEGPGSDDAALANLKHEIEIARDPQFKSVLVTQPIAAETGVASLKKVPEGNLFWRIRSYYPELPVSSDSQRFLVEKAKELALTLARPDAASAFEVRPQVLFTWNSDSANVEFLWELQTADGKEVLTQKTRGNSAVWKGAATGPYRWRVSANWKDQKVAETQWRTFSLFKGQPVALVSPVKGQEIYYWDDPAEFAFAWSKDTSVQEDDLYYVLDVAKDQEFKSLVASKKLKGERLASEGLKLAGAAASYFWRVRVIDKNNQTLKTSEPAQFAYGVHPLLKPPVQAQPEPGASINIVELETDPVLGWAQVQDATAYELTVFQQTRAPASAAPVNRVVYRKETTTPQLEVKGLKPGQYYWTVRAIDPLKRQGEAMQPRSFTITLGEPLAAPEATSPEVQ